MIGRRRAVAVAALPWLLAIAGVEAQVSAPRDPVSGAFVVMLGHDTTAVEHYTRAGNVITGDLVTRLGGTLITHYVLTVAGDGSETIVLSPRRVDGTIPRGGYASATATFSADSFVTTLKLDTMSVTRRFAVSHPAPMLGGGLGPSMAMYDALFANLRAAKTDSVFFNGLSPVANRVVALPTWIKFVGPTSARVWIRFGPPTPAGPYPEYVRLNALGEVVEFNGLETTQKVVATRVPSLDVLKLAASFAAGDAAGHGLSAATSTRDSVRAVIGSAHIAVDYSRPSVRGRDVFKNGVLNDTIWRTGANTATSFKTDADLTIAGRTIPAGTYTLWTHARPDNSAYELIFNKQTGQWGTDYNPAQDLARVALQVIGLSQPMEQFEIRVERDGAGGGVISLRWDRTELSVPFSLKTIP